MKSKQILISIAPIAMLLIPAPRYAGGEQVVSHEKSGGPAVSWCAL